jgi:tight adherence protein B
MLAVFTFIGVTAICLVLWFSLGRTSDQGVVRDRLRAVQDVDRTADIDLDLQLVRDEMLSTVPLLNRLMMQLSWSARLQTLITQAGMTTKPGKILLMSSVTALATYVALTYLFHQWVFALIGGIAGLAIPTAVVAFVRMRRLRKFEQNFPEALDLLGRAVRAGHAFTAGVDMVAKESAEPVAGEFRVTFEEQNFGLPLRDALTNLAMRVPLVDVRFLVTALLVQKDSGGNLAELLDELSRLIRERFRIRREVQIKTAQGRLTAAILICLPIGMLFVMRVINPGYEQVLFTDPWGPTILGVVALMQLVGGLFLWKIVNIEV